MRRSGSEPRDGEKSSVGNFPSDGGARKGRTFVSS